MGGMRNRVALGAAAAVVAVAAVAAVAVPLVSSSDAATTESRVAARPVEVEPAALPATVRPRWTAATAGARPTTSPADNGTVVVGGPDRVAGLDARTGAEAWSYARGNARLCGWTLDDGVVVALFKKAHGCRQVVGLDATLGTRRWYRTLEIPVDAVLSSGPGVAVATTAAGELVAVDTTTGLNRWIHRAPAGCTLDPAVAGRVAVIAVARCADGSVTLVGHDAYAEKTSWTVPPPAGGDPVALGGEDGAAVLTGTTLTTYDGTGKVLARITDRRLAGTAAATAVATGETLVVWTGTAATAVDLRSRAVRWSLPATSPPALDGDRVVLASGSALTTVQATTGARTARTAGSVPAGATLARVGPLVIAATRDRVGAYG